MHAKFFRHACVALLVLRLTAAGAAPGGDPWVDLRQRVDEIRTAHGVAATAYLVVTPDRIVTRAALGHPSWESNEPLRMDRYVRIGSITKTFLGLTVTVLSERGVLDLNDRIIDIVDAVPFENRWHDVAPLRLGHLLEHTAGLADMSAKEFAHNQPLPLDEAFKIEPNSRILQWPPGYHSSYSNTGAGIAAYMIEAVTDEPFEQAVETYVFTPLAMASATFSHERALEGGLITGYDRDGRTPIPYWHTLYRAFGGINVTPEDMAGFVQFFLNRGTHDAQALVSATAITRMETPQTTLAARAGLTYGYGLGIYQFQHKGFSFFGHGGDADGYLSHFAYSPELGAGYFVVINAFQKPTLVAMRRAIEDTIIGTRKHRPTAAARLTRAQLERFTGNYEATTYRFRRDGSRNGQGDDYRIELRDDVLYTLSNGTRKKLLPVTRTHFRRPWETIATAAFICLDGRLYLQGDMGNWLRRRPCAAQDRASAAARSQPTPVPPRPQ